MLYATTFGLQPEDSCLWLCRWAILMLSCGLATDFQKSHGAVCLHWFTCVCVCVYRYMILFMYIYIYTTYTFWILNTWTMNTWTFSIFTAHMDDHWASCQLESIWLSSKPGIEDVWVKSSDRTTIGVNQHLKTGLVRAKQVKHFNYHSSCDPKTNFKKSYLTPNMCYEHEQLIKWIKTHLELLWFGGEIYVWYCVIMMAITSCIQMYYNWWQSCQPYYRYTCSIYILKHQKTTSHPHLYLIYNMYIYIYIRIIKYIYIYLHICIHTWNPNGTRAFQEKYWGESIRGTRLTTAPSGNLETIGNSNGTSTPEKIHSNC